MEAEIGFSRRGLGNKRLEPLLSLTPSSPQISGSHTNLQQSVKLIDFRVTPAIIDPWT